MISVLKGRTKPGIQMSSGLLGSVMSFETQGNRRAQSDVIFQTLFLEEE